MNTKSVFASKTVWIQIVAIVSMLVPPVRDWFAANPVEFVSVLGAVNVIVRFATSGRISIFGAEEAPGDKERGGGPGGLSPMLVLCIAAGGLACAALPSCAHYPLTGSVSWSDAETGAEAGITFRPPVREVQPSK